VYSECVGSPNGPRHTDDLPLRPGDSLLTRQNGRADFDLATSWPAAPNRSIPNRAGVLARQTLTTTHYQTGESMTTTTTTTVTPTDLDTGLVGWLAKPPELHVSASGVPYLRCRLSVRPYVAKNEPKPQPIYYDLTAFGSLAENVARDLHEADRVVVSGRVERSTWIGRDGHERSSLGIVAVAIGLDLRFARPPDTKPSMTKPPGIITELVGPAPATDYTNEPF